MVNGFKSMLKEALSHAVSNFQESGDPNDACIKAANAAGFSPVQADRLVETFNTARAICNYKSADDKTSSCSLADKDVVKAGLSQSTSEKKAEHSQVDYSWYSSPEADHYGLREVKVAEAYLSDEPLSRENSDYLRMRDYTSRMDLAKEAESEARIARVAADELAMKVASSISRNCDIDDVHMKVAKMVHAYALDERYAPGVEKVAEFLPPCSDPASDVLAKVAGAHVLDTSDIDEYMPSVKEAADLMAAAAGMDAYAAEMLKLADGDGNGYSLRSAAMDTAGDVRGASSVAAGAAKDLQSFAVQLRDAMSDDYIEEQRRRADKATAGINNLRRQIILQDLLMTDPILSQEDPAAVVRAYRGIHQVSPASTMNKELVRSVLRSAVKAVSISPYDAKTLAELDEKRYSAASAASGGGQSSKRVKSNS